MVECPHFKSGVSIDGNSYEFSNKILEKCVSGSNKSSKVQWPCYECGDVSDCWLCLGCGEVLCGRYVSGHWLAHSTKQKHVLCVHCTSLELFCAECDDLACGDTEDLKVLSVQKALAAANGTSFPPRYLDEDADLATEVEDDYPFRFSNRSVETDEDSRSVPEDYPSSYNNSNSLFAGRLLRPRKRKEFSPPPSQKRTKFDDGITWRGLRNLGNTCFMNSILQCLSVNDVFRDYLTKLPILEPDDDVIEVTQLPLASPRYKTRSVASSCYSECQSSIFLAEELRKVLLSLADVSKNVPVAPDEFFQAVWKISPRFRGYQQQDAHEFLRCAMDRLHTELRRCRIPESADNWLSSRCGLPTSPSPAASAVTRIFEGSLLNQVVCLTCHTASNKHESFMDLSLDIGEGAPGAVQLLDCIRRFFAKEELEQKEQYMCGSCMDKRPSTKQLMLSGLPTVLCLHLKRFKWTTTSRGKVDSMVEFPLTGLDISSFMANGHSDISSKWTFDLSSVVVHHGSGTGGGHYTTFGRRNNTWFHFNDHSVKECSSNNVLKQKAYLLFYTRSHISKRPIDYGMCSQMYVTGDGKHMMSFKWPWQYDFPPFFTLQKTVVTREKQLEAWAQLLLDYAQFYKLTSADIAELSNSELFNNQKLNRRLNSEGVRAVLDFLEQKKHIEWIDSSKSRCRIYWRRPEEWASLIYNWAESNGLLNTPCTLYEITHGDDTTQESFHGLEKDVLLKALQSLENQRLAQLINIGTDAEGVKFLH